MTDTANQMHQAIKTASIEYSCLSWGGFVLFGDAKSITEATRLLHEAGKVPALQDELRAARAVGQSGGSSSTA